MNESNIQRSKGVTGDVSKTDRSDTRAEDRDKSFLKQTAHLYCDSTG
jgi:hypothetical protein